MTFSRNPQRYIGIYQLNNKCLDWPSFEKLTNNKCWTGSGEMGTLLNYWWEHKLIKPLWRTVLLLLLFQSFSRVWLFVTLWTTACQASCPSPTPGTCSNSCPSSQWCHPTILSSVIPFSSYLQSFPASWSFLMSRFFSSGGQSSGASVSLSVLPMNIQDWFLLWLTGFISLQTKGLSRVLSNTTVQKHQTSGTQLSVWSNFHIYPWLWENP